MIRWRTCRASKHCPASAYTDLLCTYVVCSLCTSKSSVENRPQPTKMSVTKMSSYQNVLLLKYPVTKTSITEVSFTKMSGYHDFQLPKYLKCPKMNDGHLGSVAYYIF